MYDNDGLYRVTPEDLKKVIWYDKPYDPEDPEDARIEADNAAVDAEWDVD